MLQKDGWQQHNSRKLASSKCHDVAHMQSNKTASILSILIAFWYCLSTQTSKSLQLSYIYLLQGLQSAEECAWHWKLNRPRYCKAEDVMCECTRSSESSCPPEPTPKHMLICFNITLTWIIWFKSQPGSEKNRLRHKSNKKEPHNFGSTKLQVYTHCTAFQRIKIQKVGKSWHIYFITCKSKSAVCILWFSGPGVSICRRTASCRQSTPNTIPKYTQKCPANASRRYPY